MHAADPGDAPARAAMAELGRTSWYLIDSLIRRKGNVTSAMDLTQDDFARLLENGTEATAGPEAAGAPTVRTP